MTALRADRIIKKSKIETIQINPGNRCNQRCVHCHIGAQVICILTPFIIRKGIICLLHRQTLKAIYSPLIHKL
jgi:hypothetical protein